MKNITWVALGVLILAQNSFAMPGLDLALNQIAKRPGTTQRAVNNCADFTGSWKGKCSFGDQSQDASVEIKQQGCESITIGSDTQYLGGLHTSSHSNSTFVAGFSGASDWSEDATQVVSNYGGLFRVPGKSEIIPLSGKSSMKLQDGKLHSSAYVIGMDVSCVYDKQ